MEANIQETSTLVKNYEATSFFQPPQVFTKEMDVLGESISLTVSRVFVGLEGCQSHIIVLTLKDLPVNISFIVLTRDYGRKEMYNRAQLRIMDYIGNNDTFLGVMAVTAILRLSLRKDGVSCFFSFERSGLSQVNIYLTLKTGDGKQATICSPEPVSPEFADKIMLKMVHEIVI